MANRKKVLTLAKELGYHSVGEYYEYMVETFLNGNKQSCRELFNEMRPDDKKEFLRKLKDKDFICYGDEIQEKVFNFLF